MPELNDKQAIFLDNIWNNFRKTLPDSVLEIYDTLHDDVVERVVVGAWRYVETCAPWVKNEMLMVLADLAFQKMRESKDKSVTESLKIITDSASNVVLGVLKK